MKRILSALFAVMMLFSMNFTAFAADNTTDSITYIYVDSVDDIDWENISSDIAYLVPNENVPDVIFPASLQLNSGIVPYGISPPDDEWNIVTQGPYDFNGSIDHLVYDLYTDYYFVGKNTYSIVCKNSYDDTVRMEAKTFWGVSLFKRWDIDAGHTLYAFIDSTDNISETTEWYLAWHTPAIVSGTVS